MNVHVRVMAAVLVPLLALAPSCAAPKREVRLQSENGETVVYVPESGGQPIEVPETELWASFRVAARELRAPADPLAFAEQTFELAEGSGTYWYFPRSGRLVPGLLGGGLEEVEGPAKRLTRGYLEWCGGTRLGGGDCLRLLSHSDVLTLHGRYVVTLVMALTASLGPMLDSLKELADPNSVAVMLASAAAMYLLLLVIPEPISKLVALVITGALIGYLGLDMFGSLVTGARTLAQEVDAATDFSQLRTAAGNFGKVLGPQMGQLLILLVSHSLGKGLAVKGKAPPPRFAEATAQAGKLTRGRLGAVAAGVRSITLDSGVITIGLTSGALMTGTPSNPIPERTEHPHGVFEGSPKHGQVQRGGVAPEPTNAQEVLDRSVQVKDTSPRRVGADPQTGEYAVFDEHRPGAWHGHVRSWNELTDEMKNALIRGGLTDRRGRILLGQ